MGLEGHKGWEGAVGLGVTEYLPSLVGCGHCGLGWGSFPEWQTGLSTWGPTPHISLPLAHLGGW